MLKRDASPMMLCGAALLAAGLSFTGGVSAPQPSGMWLDVPFVKQDKNGCGAASLAMVMQYWQRQRGEVGESPKVELEQIKRALYSRRAHGIYASDMVRYLQQHGFRTFAFAGEWKDLREQLEKGRPLIVALAPERSDRHYVVVAGMDWQRGVVLKNDPAERKLLEQGRSDFEKEWKAAGNWTLLAVPRQEDHASPP
jgi:ABC-type bacteriocin/lantibiotic exporter with double-glycine peptidase domain